MCVCASVNFTSLRSTRASDVNVGMNVTARAAPRLGTTMMIMTRSPASWQPGSGDTDDDDDGDGR